MKKIQPLKSFLAMAVLTLSAGVTYGQTVFSDDFESYPDLATLQTVWANNSAPPAAGPPAFPAGIGLDLTNKNYAPIGGTKAVFTSYAHDGAVTTLPESIGATTPCLVTFYLFRNSINNSVGQTRHYFRVGPATPVPTSSVGAGWFNNATMPVNGVADAIGVTNFQGYFLGGGGNSVFNLINQGVPLRTIGWHKFDIERRADGSTRYYVDNVLGRTITNASAAWTYLHAGFRTTSAVPAIPGEEVALDGVSVITNNPTVDTPPANLTPALGASTNLTVVASGAPTGYRWFFGAPVGGVPNRIYSTNYFPISGDNISGETTDTLTINPVRTTNEGYYFVIVSNANGYIGSATARLVVGPPSIGSHTTNRSALQGGNFTINVNASGAPTLAYQWQKEGVPIAGATASAYTKTGVAVTDAGNYRVVVTNTFGAITSGVSVVTIVTNPQPTAMTLLWKKLPADFPWLGAGNLVRGLAYNALSNHVLLVSRNAGDFVHVLDGDTGAELHTLDITGIIGGGTFNINMIGVADDGVVYYGNLTTDANATNFKLYRHSDSGPTSVASVAFDGNPGNGFADRWGDVMAVRGAGNDTQVLLTSRTGTNAAILTTVDGGFTFTATTLPCDVLPNAIGVGATFGVGNTFWATSNDASTNALFHFSFDVGAATTTRLQTYTNTLPEGAILGGNQAGNLLGVIGIETPNALRLYDISSYPAQPLLLDWEFFTPNVTGFAVGNAAFGNNRVYSLNANNGIVALNINWPKLNFTTAGSTLNLNWVGTYQLQAATNVAGPYGDVTATPVLSPYSTNTTSPVHQFFRLTFP